MSCWKGMDHWAKSRPVVTPPGPSIHALDADLSLMHTKMLSCKVELVLTHTSTSGFHSGLRSVLNISIFPFGEKENILLSVHPLVVFYI